MATSAVLPRCRRRTISAAGVILALLLSACGGGQPQPALSRLERLAFVPAGSCVLFKETMGVDCSTDRPLLVDRFEITRREWREWVADRGAESSEPASWERWSDETRDYPATGMDLAEARAFAAAEGMRLPTAREWVRVAVGTRAQEWPWGPFPARSVTNTLELRLRRLAPVGTFEAGRTSLGVHDLLGNAAEWVEDVIPEREPEDDDGRVWALGGSYLTHKRPTYYIDRGATPRLAFNAELLDPRTRASDVGFRLVADAEEHLRRGISHGDGAEDRTRLRAIGRRWGRSAVPLLRRLAEERGAPTAFAELLAGAEE